MRFRGHPVVIGRVDMLNNKSAVESGNAAITKKTGAWTYSEKMVSGVATRT